MSALAYLPEEDAPASRWPILGARSKRLELPIQRSFRARAKIVCPRVKVVAIPNGTHIASQAGRRKANDEGRSAGFPDVICLWSHGRAPESVIPQFAAIEFKAGDASPSDVSDNQNEWLDWLQAAGFACVVSRHEDHAIEFLRGLGAPFIDRVGRL